MDYENNPNSQLDVVTTVAHVLAEYESVVATEIPNIAITYDQELSYETGLREYLAGNDVPNQSILPMFIYNRQILNDGENGLMKRARHQKGYLKLSDGALTYSLFQGELSINFLYVSKGQEDAEKFEIAYLTDEGISACKEIRVNMPEIGEFSYFCKYEDLEDINIEHNGQFYKGIAGNFKIRGFYFTFSGRSGLIKELNSRIISSNNIPNRKVDEILANNLLDEV